MGYARAAGSSLHGARGALMHRERPPVLAASMDMRFLVMPAWLVEWVVKSVRQSQAALLVDV